MKAWWRRHWTTESFRWSLLVSAAAAAVRVINLLFLAQNDPAFYVPQIDSLWHHRWAIEIISGNFWGDQVFFRAPLYPYLLALIYWIFGIKIFVAKFIQAIGGALTCVLIYQLGRTAFTERVGRLASLLAVLYGTLILYESELLIEWLPILFNLWMLLLMLRRREDAPLGRWFCIGLLGGLSTIARPNVLLVFPFLALWLWLGQRRSHGWLAALKRPLMYAMGIAICVLPVTIRNYVVGHDVVMVSSQGGVNFYLGNNPEADGLTMVMPEIRLDLSIPWSEFVDTTDAYAQHDQGRPLRPSEISSYWNDKGWKWVFEHPANFLALTGKRIVYLFSGFENSDQADIYRFSENSPILQTLIFDRGVKFPFGVVAPLALIGLLLAWPERRKLAPIYLFLLGYTPTIVLFLVTARHRLAVIVLFLIFAAFAFSRILDAMMERRREAIGLIAAFAVLLALLNLRPFDLGYDTSGQYHYQRGLVFEKQGRLDEAIGEYRESLKYQPIPEAFNNLGYALARRDDFAGAYQAYQQGLRAKPNAADILANLGLLFLNVNQLDSAEHYLTRSRSVNPKLAQVYVNLAELYDRGGEAARCEQAYRDGIAAVENYGPLYNGLANFLLKSNRGDEALAVLAAGTAAAPEYAIGHANFANLLFEKSDLRAARSAYAQALRLDPSLNQARLNLAVLFVRSNFPDSARVELETILRLDPNFAPARQLLEKIR